MTDRARITGRARPTEVSDQRLRSDQDCRRYWWSRTLSSAGSVVTLVALPVLIFRMTGSALLTASTSAFEAARYIAFGLPGCFPGGSAGRAALSSAVCSERCSASGQP